jgi:hypothetical protein
MWSALAYEGGAPRGNAGVIESTALILEVDHQEPNWALLDHLDYVAYTSHSHSRDDPHWRIVLFLAEPIPAAEYNAVWAQARYWLCGEADEGAKPLAQPFYLPSCLPGTTPATRTHPGEPLDWRALEPVPEEPSPEPPPPREPVGGRPGDDYNARADWADILAGWTFVGQRRDGVVLVRRPGKDRDWSATIGYGGYDRLFVFSSNAPPFQPRKSYSKFEAYAALEHGGDYHAAARALDYHAAARALADAGYGAIAPTLPETIAECRTDGATVKIGGNTGETVTVAPSQRREEVKNHAGSAVEDRPEAVPSPALSSKGLVYRLDGLTVTIKPLKRKDQVTVHRGTILLGTDKIDLGDSAQRRKLYRALKGISEAKQATLDAFCVGVVEVLENDRTAWIGWVQEEMGTYLARRLAEQEAAEQAKRAARAAAIEDEARALLAKPSLLYDAGLIIGQLGVAREEANTRLLYAIVASRVMSKPISVAVKGESASGKNNLVDKVLQLAPADAYYDLTSMSERALIYDERDYRHKFILFYEAHGHGKDDSLGQYLMRSLISEGCIKHMVVETKDGPPHTVQIEKQGPTGFITTTTAPELHGENETRLWSLAVDDSDETTAIVHAKQAQAAARQVPTVDVTPWQIAQEWIALAGATEAVVPFAPILAKAMPNKPLRLRRDFPRLLALIEVVAVLHQLQRECDQDGRVIATLADYAMARTLAEAVFRRALQGVSEKTLELVAALDTVLAEKQQAGTREVVATYADLTAKTKRPKQYISRHLEPALKLGLVENLTTEKGKAARLGQRFD